MNTQQLQHAADTVASIGEHMDMPDVGGVMLSVLATKHEDDETQGTVHVVTTDNDEQALIDSIQHAMEQSPELRKILCSAAARVIVAGGTDAALSGFLDRYDPTSESYWSESDMTDPDFDPVEEAKRLAEAADRRAKVFNKLDEKDQTRFWEIERAVANHVEPDGYVPFITVLNDVSVSRKVLKRLLLEAGCELITGQGRIFIHAAPSVFRL